MIKMLKVGMTKRRNFRTEYYLLYPSSRDVVSGVYEEKRRHASKDCHNYRIKSLPESGSLGIERNPRDLPLIALSKERDRQARGEVLDDARKETGKERERMETRQKRSKHSPIIRVQKEGLALLSR